MTTDIDTDDQAGFEAEFFGTEAPKAEEPENEVVETPETDDQPEDDGAETPDDPLAPEDEEEPEDEDAPEEEVDKPGKNRKSAQARINELTAKVRETERREAAEKATFMRRIEELEAAVKESKPKAKVQDILPEGAPKPDALDEDGEPVYALGEFDPNFLRDLTKFTFKEEMKEAEKQREQNAIQAKIEEEREVIKTQWVDRLDKYEEDVPDIREKISDLTNTFQSVEPGYGEYLATTLMVSDYGVQIMEYLSDNIGEAQKIVASGPAAATLALGRLEARFVKAETPAEDKPKQQKVTEAGTPPESANRGRGAKFNVPIDTDNQDAFEKEFFKKR